MEIPEWPQLTKALTTVSERGDLLREGRRLLSHVKHPAVIDWILRVDIECGELGSSETAGDNANE